MKRGQHTHKPTCTCPWCNPTPFRKGRIVTEQTRQNISRALTGKKLSAAHRKKVSEGNRRRFTDPRERMKVARYCALDCTCGRHLPFTPERLAKMSASNKGKKRSPEMCAGARARRLKQRLPLKDTFIERLLKAAFMAYGLAFEEHKTMFGRFQPDFVFASSGLIVQADGDYWHGPKSVNVERDHRFNETAAHEGWVVWRFGEAIIKKHTAMIAYGVARFVQQVEQAKGA